MIIELSPNAIAIIAILISGLSALYARWSVREARKANDIGRLNALLAFRSHYLDLIKHQAELAEILKNSDSGMQSALEMYGTLNGKLREVNKEIDAYHGKVVSNGI